MIKRTLIGAIILLVAYNILIKKFRPGREVAQHDWEKNAINAQHYLFDDTIYENVIVGTSLAAQLPQDSLKDFYNLCFSGLGSLDGLKILFEKDKLPRKVFIETNLVTKPEDESFTAAFSNPVSLYGRKYLLSMRDGRQPLGFVSSHLSDVIEKPISWIKRQLATQQNNREDKSTAKQKEVFFKKLLAERIQLIEQNSLTTNSQKVNTSYQLLEHYVNRLRQLNVEVVFFEMPVNSKICNLQGPLKLRNDLLRMFPLQQYKYIPQPDCSDYITKDGLHLTTLEAARYVNYFKTVIKREGY